MSSAWEAEARARSAACLRYIQLAHPAQAKTARMSKVMPMTMVLRFKGIKTSSPFYASLPQQPGFGTNMTIR
jgi:hypothetical protein